MHWIHVVQRWQAAGARRQAMWGALALGAVLAGCSGLPKPPSQPARYDLGVVPVQAAPAAPSLAPVALADIQAPLQADGNTAMHYRLAYAQPQVLHAYTQARWSLPPSQLVQQRLREHVGSGGRVVLSAESGALPPSVQGRQVPILRLALEEFSQVFDDTTRNAGVVRVRATLVDPAPRGDVLLAQQVFDVRQPAAAANAAAGVQALSAGVNTVGQQLQQWLQSVLPPAR